MLLLGQVKKTPESHWRPILIIYEYCAPALRVEGLSAATSRQQDREERDYHRRRRRECGFIETEVCAGMGRGKRKRHLYSIQLMGVRSNGKYVQPIVLLVFF